MKLFAKRIVGFSLLGAFLLATPFAMAARDRMPSPYNSLPWTYGGKSGDKVTLCGVLEMDLPEGYATLSKSGTQRLNTMTENPQTDECATIAPVSMDWFVMLGYDKIGYVKDDDEIDPDALMKDMKRGIEYGNKERKQRGWPELEMVGWVIKPKYDKSVNRLIWATKLTSDGHESINYETRILGREGVTEVILVSAPEDMDQAIKEFNMLASKMSYVEGKRYDEFKDGDKVAKYGLAALITGGVVAAAAQSGFLKSFGKIIGAAVIAVGAFVANFFRKLFGRKVAGDQTDEASGNIDDDNNQPPTV